MDGITCELAKVTARCVVSLLLLWLYYSTLLAVCQVLFEKNLKYFFGAVIAGLFIQYVLGVTIPLYITITILNGLYVIFFDG